MEKNKKSECKGWKIRELSKAEYEKITQNKLKNIFNTAGFACLNADKVEVIKYILIYKNESPRFSVIFGKRNNGVLACPFSAPFGYIEEVKRKLGLSDYCGAIEALDDYFRELMIKKVEIIFPPLFYDNDVISAWCNTLLVNKWEIEYFEINFALHIPTIVDNYREVIAHNARKNLRIAENSGLSMKICISDEEKIEAYEIIKKNRESKGYPLRMSRQQVMDTIQYIDCSMYIVSLRGMGIASAIIYKVADSIAQVIYWGDIPGYSEYKPINYLAYELLKIYKEKGFEYLDIGPATENGIASYGLCDFKDSIGCERSLKIKMTKNYD